MATATLWSLMSGAKVVRPYVGGAALRCTGTLLKGQVPLRPPLSVLRVSGSSIEGAHAILVVLRCWYM